MKIKNTGRAMAISAIVICVSFAMLLGTTFAWFTSTASTKVNTITTGKFEIDIVDANDATLQGSSLSFVTMNGNTETKVDDFYWEPGMVVRTETFKVVNKGNYSVTFKLDDVFANTKIEKAGNADLTDVITYEIKSGTDDVAVGEEFDLEVGGEKSFYIEFTMATTAGNEYQESSITFKDAAVYVSAAQGPAETDSYGDTFDTAAEYDDGVVKG